MYLKILIMCSYEYIVISQPWLRTGSARAPHGLRTAGSLKKKSVPKIMSEIVLNDTFLLEHRKDCRFKRLVIEARQYCV